eukprot:scaffold4737_cov371-Prasinococcus_capsulatus_cf.AAC.7
MLHPEDEDAAAGRDAKTTSRSAAQAHAHVASLAVHVTPAATCPDQAVSNVSARAPARGGRRQGSGVRWAAGTAQCHKPCTHSEYSHRERARVMIIARINPWQASHTRYITGGPPSREGPSAGAPERPPRALFGLPGAFGLSRPAPGRPRSAAGASASRAGRRTCMHACMPTHHHHLCPIHARPCQWHARCPHVAGEGEDDAEEDGGASAVISVIVVLAARPLRAVRGRPAWSRARARPTPSPCGVAGRALVASGWMDAPARHRTAVPSEVHAPAVRAQAAAAQGPARTWGRGRVVPGRQLMAPGSSPCASAGDATRRDAASPSEARAREDAARAAPRRAQGGR